MDFIKLEDGMVLRLLPFNFISFYDIQNQYYLLKINKMFIDDKLIKYIDSSDYIKFNYNVISRRTRCYSIVEYDGELKMIYYGLKIKDIIDKSIDNDIINFKSFNSFLYVNKKIINGRFPNYDDSFIIQHHNKPFKYDYNSLFQSDDYLYLINQYNNYINSKKPNSIIIKHLIEENILDNNYIGKMRKIKLNKIKNNV